MTDNSKPLNSVRRAGYVFPPAGLWLLWRSRELSLGRKLFGTIGLLVYAILYSALIIALLVFVFGLQIEWRGGFPPVLTWSKSVPNYDALETHRAQQNRRENKSGNLQAVSNYWTEFRGPGREGKYNEQPISTNWPSEGLPLIWRQPIGGGYASFVIADGRAYTIEQRREKEAVTAYDVATGNEIWAHTYNAKFEEPLGGEGPRATPTFDDGKLYSLGGLGDLICLEAATGNVVWSKNILPDNQAELLTYGMSSSPLIVGEKLIVSAGGPNGKSIVAYDKSNGKPIWKTLNDPAAYSSPMLVNLAGVEQLLIVTAERAVGLNVESGKLLWEFPWVVNQGNRNIAQPVLLSTNRVFLSASYGTGCVAIEVNKSEAGFTVRQIWRNKLLKNKFTSSVFHQDFIYGLDEDILTCLDANTGTRKWKDGRYGYGQLFLANEHLVILSGDGHLALVKATPDLHQELARFPAIRGKTWNHPAISGGKIFVRNLVEMACFELSPQQIAK